MGPVWESTLDGGLFLAKVDRTKPYCGELTVTHIETNTIFMRQDVGLAYDAVFGPDVSDLFTWQQAVIIAVDDWYRQHGQEPPY